MSDPLDLTRLITGATAAIATALPEPLRTVLRVLDEGIGLAVALRDAGHEPLGKIAEMRRAVEDFAAARRKVHDEVDAIVDATLATPRTPTEPEGQPVAPADGGV
jgi:hypothetical protein